VLQRENQNNRVTGQTVEESVHDEQPAPDHDPTSITNIVVSAGATISNGLVAAASQMVGAAVPPVLQDESAPTSSTCVACGAEDCGRDCIGNAMTAATTATTTSTSIGSDHTTADVKELKSNKSDAL
jgi:hypothetical protein